MAIADELQKLDELRQRGALTDDEYAKAKAHVFDQAQRPNAPDESAPATAQHGQPLEPAEIERETRFWGMLIHISLLAGFLLPYAGLVVPILIWQLKKGELPEIDVHGKIAANWIISLTIYGVASALLCVVFIGIPLLLALAVMHVVFPIIGAVKANEGQAWPYPLSIRFFS
jgi:uncharacterized protein